MWMDDVWQAYPAEDVPKFIENVNPIGDKYEVSAEKTYIDSRSLPFYDSVKLIRVKNPEWSERSLFIYYLSNNGDLYWLNGTSPPIHEVNAKANIKLTPENSLTYLEFFSFFVRGEEGPFALVQSIEDTYMPKLVDEETRAAYKETIHEAFYEGLNEDNQFMWTCSIYYANAIFESRFAIDQSGMIEMISDLPVLADLPVKIHAPIS